MKVSEIILEADPVKLPNFGTAGQPYSVNYNMGGTTPLAKVPAAVDLKTRPIDILRKAFPKKIDVANAAAEKSKKAFFGSKFFKILGITTLAPVIVWIDDMTAINVMFDQGHFNSYGDKAGEVAQQMRTSHTQLLYSRMATTYVTWWATVKATSGAVRLAMGLIPGAGWIATLTSTAVGLAVTAMLQTDSVQKFITMKLIDNIPYLGDAVYELAKATGGVGSAMPSQTAQQVSTYVSRLKDKFVKNTAAAVPQPVKTGAAAVSNAAKTAANRVAPLAPPAPLGKVSDLAKEF